MLLIDEFLQSLEVSRSRITKKLPHKNPLFDSGLVAIQEAARMADKIYFESTTMRMLADKLHNLTATREELMQLHPGLSMEQAETTLLKPDQGFWLQFQKPITFENGAIPPISVLFLTVPANYLDTGVERYHLYLIDETAEIYTLLTSNLERDSGWSFEPYVHTCTQCRVIDGIEVLCAQCEYILSVWSRIFSLSAIISGQYLAAMKYEKKVFTGVRHVPRRNEKKTRRVASGYTFKCIDANEIIIPVRESVPPAQTQDESWLERARASDNVVYKELCTRPFARTYRAERYRESGLQGTTIYFPEGLGRKQPVRKDRLGMLVKKVTSSQYEE